MKKEKTDAEEKGPEPHEKKKKTAAGEEGAESRKKKKRPLLMKTEPKLVRKKERNTRMPMRMSRRRAMLLSKRPVFQTRHKPTERRLLAKRSDLLQRRPGDRGQTKRRPM